MHKAFAVIALLAVVSAAVFPAHAQEATDPIAAAIRLEQLERRLMVMEEKLFAAQQQNNTMPGDAARMTDRVSAQQGAGAAPVASENLSAGAETLIADFELRLQQLETEWRQLYGGVEELGHAVERLAEKVDLIARDHDLRLQDLESGAVKPVAKENAEQIKQTARAQNKPREDVALDPQQHYERAYNYLTAAAYPEAERWFQSFLEKHKEHKLADNAYYWLGEVYLVQGDAEKAVIEFSNGLSAFPNGNKAAANLLKMGIAFRQLDRTDHARSAWNKLLRDFPNTPEAAKAREHLDKLS